MRRSLAGALWLIAGLLASFLGAMSALVDTASGRALLARVASDAVRGVFDGFVQIGDVRGPLITGVTLRNVTVFDPDSTLVASLRRVDASYNPFDFIAGRVVLLELSLASPVINVVQHKSGRLNVEELLRLGVPSKGPKGPGTLILFRNVHVSDGTVNMRLQASGDQTGHEIDPLELDGRRRIRRFEHLEMQLSALRISSPREPGVRLDISRLSVTSTDPDVVLRDVHGRITVVGDSLQADLERLDLPASRLAGHGSVRWPHDTLLFDLTLRADSATLGDVGFLGLPFPASARLTGALRVRSHGARLLEVKLDPLDVRYGGGALTGRLTTLTAADSGLVAIRDADLTAQHADLDLVRGVVSTLPFHGRLSGHTTADGPVGALAVDLDWAFQDSLVAGWPESRVEGSGTLDLSGEDLRFVPFAVRNASVDLATVRQLVPAVQLRGDVGGSGSLAGPLHNALFTGTLVHRDGTRPPSTVRGSMRLDTRTDTVGVFADVRADSLSFDGLRGSYPELPLRGTVAGPIRLEGSVAALETHATLESSAGAVTMNGVITLLDTRTGVRDLALGARNVDLARWVPGGPESRVSFAVSGGIAQDTGAAPVGELTAALAPSFIAGTQFDSGQAAVRFAEGRLYVDSLRVTQGGLATTGSGSLGWRRPDSGSLSLVFDAAKLNALDSLVAWVAGPDAVPNPRNRSLRGAARVTLALSGALDSLAIDARASADSLRWRDWEVSAGRAHVAYRPGSDASINAEAALDSIRHGAYAFGGASATIAGRVDSLSWFARSRVGDLVAFVTGGRLARRGTAFTVGLDSLAVLLPGSVWLLQRPAHLEMTDSTVDFSGGTLANIDGSGRVAFEPMQTTRGRADAHGKVEGFPLAAAYALFERDTSGVGGTISATVALRGSRDAPVYEGSLTMSNGRFGEFHAPYVDGTFGYRERRLDAALRLWRAGQQILTVTGHLPLDLSLVPVARRQLPDTLAVTARADSVDLSVLAAITPLVRDVQGGFSADVGIAGTWDAPRLQGVARVADAAATFPDLNVRYTGVTGTLALTGDTIAVQSLTARSDKGRMDVAGYIRLEQLTRPVLALRITADRFKALDLKGNVTVTASGRLALTGPVFGATLTGQATVTSGVLYFADLITKRILNLEEFADTAVLSVIQRQGLGAQFQSVFLDSLHIHELQLTMSNEVWLRSNEANIQLQGTVTLTKQRNNYLVSGTLQAPRGTYRLKIGVVTREFVVTQGSVRYFGTPDLDAELNIEATHTVHPVPTSTTRGCVAPNEDIVVIAHITGTLLVPKVSLEAQGRDCGQTEVISYLMFGKSSFELTGSQGAGGIGDQRALLQAAASVLSGELERTIVSDLGVPLDYLEIRPGAQQGPLQGLQLVAGRQVGARTFLVANAGFCQGQAVAASNTFGLTLKFRISTEFRTEASYQPVQQCNATGPAPSVTRQFGVDVIWERWY